MKKLILIVFSCLILTSCSSTVKLRKNAVIDLEEISSVAYIQEKSTYINDNMKKTIDEINNLKEKYEESLELDDDFSPIYIDIYEIDDMESSNHRSMENNIIISNNRRYYNLDYFNDIVEILDKQEAVGLKDYVEEAYNMKLEPNEIIIKKIGRTVVHVENRIGNEEYYIAINMNIRDIRDEEYRKVFHKISDDKYIFSNIFIGENLNLISFVNDELLMNNYNSKFAKIRYEVLLKDKDINKVNILVSRNREEKLKEEDIEVFNNLLDILKLREDSKEELIKKYENIFKEKISREKLKLDGYNIYINGNKGNKSIETKVENIYISIKKD